MTHPKAILRLCLSCGATSAQIAGLQSVLDRTGCAVQVVGQACFNACGSPIALSLQGPGRATYFFHGVNIPEDRDDISRTVAHYLASPAGWFEDATPCGRLRFCLVGRVPALDG